MRPALLLVPALALLAACQTPREACLSGATRQLSIVDGLIQQTQGNLSRGYAVEEEQVVREVPDFCRTRDREGRVRRTFCERTVVRDVARPVAIDPSAEQAKLDNLLERRAQLLSERDARVQACQALPDA